MRRLQVSISNYWVRLCIIWRIMEIEVRVIRLSRTCPRQMRYFNTVYIQKSVLSCHFHALFSFLELEKNTWHDVIDAWILYYTIVDVNDSIPRPEGDIKTLPTAFSQSERKKYFELIIICVKYAFVVVI